LQPLFYGKQAAWARGEITGEQMKSALLASHKIMAAKVMNNA
jgi:hypothetical protein